MKIKAELLKHQHEFVLDVTTRYVALVGGYACVHPDTKIFTTEGLVRIADITKPTHVLSWNEKDQQYQYSLTGGAYPKGIDYLYQIATTRGVFAATGHHRVFCADGTWKQIRNLNTSDQIQYCPTQSLTKLGKSYEVFDVGVQNYSQTDADSIYHYAVSARQYGQQLLQDVDIDPVVPVNYTYHYDNASFSSYRSCSISTIISITKTNVKYPYYDMQVLDTNNYVSEDGTIHHNSGKTHALAYKAIYLAMLNVGHLGLILSPIHSMNTDNVVPKFAEVLSDLEIPFSYTVSPHPKFILHFAFGTSTVLFGAAENYKRIAGLNLAWYICDEVDTTEHQLMHRVWRMLESRLRSIGAPHPQGCCVSTPEGYKFLYDYFEKDLIDKPKLKTQRKLIRARTMDNPYLDKDYLQSLRDSYPANLIEAYLNGQFVNMHTNGVYPSFNEANIIDDFEDNENFVLHIGVDFNVGNMNAVVCVKAKKRIIVIDEIQLKNDKANTYAMADAIKFKYPNRKIILYPDATGRNRSTNTVDIDNTNHKILRDAGFNLVFSNSGNPPVEDRTILINSKIRSMNGDITLHVHERCSNLINSFKSRQYKNGVPEKDGVTDHGCDCIDYVVWELFNTIARFSQYSAQIQQPNRRNILLNN